MSTAKIIDVYAELANGITKTVHGNQTKRHHQAMGRRMFKVYGVRLQAPWIMVNNQLWVHQ